MVARLASKSKKILRTGFLNQKDSQREDSSWPWPYPTSNTEIANPKNAARLSNEPIEKTKLVIFSEHNQLEIQEENPEPYSIMNF